DQERLRGACRPRVDLPLHPVPPREHQAAALGAVLRPALARQAESGDGAPDARAARRAPRHRRLRRDRQHRALCKRAEKAAQAARHARHGERRRADALAGGHRRAGPARAARHLAAGPRGCGLPRQRQAPAAGSRPFGQRAPRLYKNMRIIACIALLHAGIALAQNSVIAPPEHRRGAEQTFLTYPEWFLVHSPAEYAAYVRDHTPTLFPFFGHIRQFWQGYGAVYSATRKDYPFNFGYHVMVTVIGTSTTAEYALRAAYETLIGRLGELAAAHGLTDEDRYAAAVAQD